MKREQVCTHITDAGIIPAIRVPSAEDARFAITTLAAAGLPVIELTMTTPGALGLLGELTRTPGSSSGPVRSGTLRPRGSASTRARRS
jgi:2-dehydro-3-deoxyphosphogluconate aldolase/(4S)-4-hydroxy-2-oxoglutarate aldolase